MDLHRMQTHLTCFFMLLNGRGEQKSNRFIHLYTIFYLAIEHVYSLSEQSSPPKPGLHWQ